MSKRVSRLTLEHLRRLQSYRYEFKKSLLKSLLKSHNNLSTNKILWNRALRVQPLVSTICRQNSLCIVTGRARGLQKWVTFSRQTLKRRALENRVQNLRVGSW